MNAKTDEAQRLIDAEAESPPAGGSFVYAAGARPLDGFTIKRGVGQGGFGEIYYALSDGGKQVALKLIRRHLDVELRGMQQCLNLSHPHLVALYDIRNDARGDTWVVMEYVSGPSLEDVLREHPQGLPAADAMSWFHGIASAVAYLHDRGIVHRDLKPGNVFSSEGVVKVGDYGLSKYISCSRRSGHTESIGTVHYMAPEIARGCYGKEIDIYALGVILCEVLTGRLPFDGETVGEVLMKHLADPPDLTGLDEPYRSVVARALEKDPSNRFATVHEMLAALPEMPQGPVVWLADASATNAGINGAASDDRPTRAAAVGDVSAEDETATIAVGKRGAQAKVVATRSTPIVAEVVPSPTQPEEPIARNLRETIRRLRRGWQHMQLSTPVKLALILIAAFILLQSAAILVPLAVFLCIIYGCYYVVWLLVRPNDTEARSINGGSHPAGTQQAKAAAAAHAPVDRATMPLPGSAQAARRPKPHDPAAIDAEIRRNWAAQPAAARLAELLGSMIVAALVCAVTTLVLVLISGYHGAPLAAAPGIWLYLVSLLGTYGVLIAAHSWNRAGPDPLLRRFVLLAVGLLVGALAAVLGDALIFRLPHSIPWDEAGLWRLPAAFYAADGAPQLPAMMAAMGTLFALIRWGRQADLLRPVRLSVWSLVVSGAVAVVAAALWHFPQPWLPMIAVAISVSVQLSAPWRQRKDQARD